MAPKDFRAYVGGAPSFVLENIVLSIFEDDRVFQTLQFKFSSTAVGEDEFPKFKVSEDDAILVAGPHRLSHLSEESFCF